MAEYNQCEDFMDIDSEAVQQALVSEIAEHRKAALSRGTTERRNFATNSTTQLVKPTTPKSRPNVVLVIDTNYFISHLRFLQHLLQILPTPQLLFFVPYVVIHELDSLKQHFERRSASAAVARRLPTESDMRGSEPDLSICAKQAIAFLHKYLLTDHPGIRGQRVDQYLPGTNLSQVTNDDKILECCRFAQANLTENVLMLSNDKNLCVKAHIHGVGTVSQYKGSPEALVGEIGQQFGLPNMKIVPYHPIPKRNRPQPVSNGHGHEPVAAPVGLISDDDVLMGDADEVKRDHSDKEFDSDGMDVDEQGNPIYPVRAPPYQDPSDPMEVVCNGLVDMLLGCMPPSLTTLLRRNLGRLAPEPPKRWSIQLIADTLHDNRHTAFHKVLSDRFFSEDLPFLKRTAKDLDRGKERNRVLVTKGELLKLMDIGVRLVDCCSGAGFPDDRDRALRLLRGMKETLA